MPDEVRLDDPTPEPSPRRRRRRTQSRSAATRHVSSLRRSQRRLVGEERSTPAPLDEDRAGPEPAIRSDDPADAAGGTCARLRAALVRPGRGQILAAVILFIVGAAGAMQIRINTADDTYASARSEVLIQLLDGLSAESRRL